MAAGDGTGDATELYDSAITGIWDFEKHFPGF